VLGESPRLVRLGQTLAGDLPALDREWIGAERLALSQGLANGEEQDKAILLQRAEDGLAPAEPITAPGVYVPLPEPRNKRLAVNVEAKAGDTRKIDEARLELWLNNAGEWSWLDMADPGASLAAAPNRAPLAWPLLWIVLAIFAVETVLARLFSHASTRKETTVAQLAGMVRKLHSANG